MEATHFVNGTLSATSTIVARAASSTGPLGGRSPYGYTPTDWICILFLVLYGISTVLHIGEAAITRSWFIYPTAVLAGILELLGWGARYASSGNVHLKWAFQMQITCTIIGPTPLLAANFIILGRIIEILGPAYSRLSPKRYSVIFCTGDVISLIVQGLGGGVASAAFGKGKSPDKGGNIMLAGILFQMFCLIVFTLCFIEYFVRYFVDKPVKSLEQPTKRKPMTQNLQLMSAGLTFTILVIFVRSIYRTIELLDGWQGRIITTEVYFDVMDGAMIILATYCLNFIHPGFLLRKQPAGERIKLDSLGA
ncbi:RTA1 like protein-domain-containing protein [Schizophyllum commune]